MLWGGVKVADSHPQFWCSGRGDVHNRQGRYNDEDYEQRLVHDYFVALWLQGAEGAGEGWPLV